jgi:hypothetical protein
MLDRPEKGRRKYCIVHYDRKAVVMRDVGYLLEIGDIVLRITDRFEIHKPGIAVDQSGYLLRMVRVEKSHLDSELL